MDSIDVYWFQRGWSDARAGVPLSLSECAAYIDGWRLYAAHYPERVAAFSAFVRAGDCEACATTDRVKH